MWLIEYSKGKFVNGECIDWIEVKGGFIQLTVTGDQENIYKVDLDLNDVFLNHLNCLNGNICKVEITVHEDSQ